jgi:hypothetical protein
VIVTDPSRGFVEVSNECQLGAAFPELFVNIERYQFLRVNITGRKLLATVSSERSRRTESAPHPRQFR